MVNSDKDYLVEWYFNQKEFRTKEITPSQYRVYHHPERCSFGFVILVKAKSLADAIVIGQHYIELRYGCLSKHVGAY